MAMYALVHGGGHDGWCYQKVARARSEGRLWEIDTGHDLMISAPKEVAAALEEVAAR